MLFHWHKKRHKKIVRLLRASLKVQLAQLEIQQQINNKLPPLRTTTTFVKFTTGDTTMPSIDAVKLKIGQSSTGTINPGEGGTTVITPGAVVSAQTATITDAGISLVMNADGTFTVTGLGATAGPVTGSQSSTVTDVDGTVTNFTNPFTVEVEAPPARTTTTFVSFSDPTP